MDRGPETGREMVWGFTLGEPGPDVIATFGKLLRAGHFDWVIVPIPEPDDSGVDDWLLAPVST